MSKTGSDSTLANWAVEPVRNSVACSTVQATISNERRGYMAFTININRTATGKRLRKMPVDSNVLRQPV